MGRVNPAPVVMPIAAVLFAGGVNLPEIETRLQSKMGKVIRRSRVFRFEQTTYYREEMGADLRKYFVSFSSLLSTESFPDLKLRCNQIEQESAIDGCRRINIDPGYIELAKLVLMTTKNFAHRIHLGKGIYGDVHLVYRGDHFEPMPWTYPDYRENDALAFFNEARRDCYERLKSMGLLPTTGGIMTSESADTRC